MAADGPKRYLIIVQFPPDMFASDLTKRVPSIRNVISSLCNDEMEQFFRSPEGNTFGMFFKTAKPMPVIKSVLDGATTNADHFMVVEIGETATSKGFTRTLTWLQRH
jgi:hypothetical protein